MPRRSEVDKTNHREEIEHLLIDQQWSSRTVEQYLILKYNVRIAESSLRTWRDRRVKRREALGTLPASWNRPDPADQSPRAIVTRIFGPIDRIPDVMAERLRLIELQKRRIQMDAEHEIGMGKQFVSNGKEIDLLNRLLNDLKVDMQEFGMLPAPANASPAVQANFFTQQNGSPAGERSEEEQRVIDGTVVRDLDSFVEGIDPDVLRDAARTLRVVRQDES